MSQEKYRSDDVRTAVKDYRPADVRMTVGGKVVEAVDIEAAEENLPAPNYRKNDTEPTDPSAQKAKPTDGNLG